MAGLSEIKTVLISRLTSTSSGASLPAASLALQNRSLSVANDARWYRATVIPARPDTIGMSTPGSNRHRGILQVDIFEPKNRGDTAVTAEAERILTYFRRGTKITASSVDVWIDESHCETAFELDDSFQVPVQIMWNCDRST